MRKINLLLLFSLLTLPLWAQRHPSSIRPQIDLRGDWHFELDPDGTGTERNFQKKRFSDVVYLPGTTDTNQKGNLNRKTDETTHLSRIYTYVGKAWYKKEVEIPEGWKGKDIYLKLERTRPTRIWVDGKEAGANDAVSTMQLYKLSTFLSPGKHEIAIRVDNGESVPPQLLGSSHAYTESTQTNWNGIIGEICLEARSRLHIENIRLYPDAKRKTVRVKVNISAPDKIAGGTKIRLSARAWNSSTEHKAEVVDYPLERSKGEYEFEYPLGSDALLWSEFHPALYQLDVTINGYDTQSVNFGLRDFAAQGTQFTINGNRTFLRGKHDACVFPLTAHTAMDLDTWRHYFRVAKSYGINHYRFHSWCPPEACFDAADIEGIYLQPELPFWGTLKRDDDYLVSYLRKEGVNIQDEYGNHASFVLFALGNELFGDQDVMESLINTFRERDDRHLYAYGSNNYLGYKGQIPGEDFLVTCRIGGEAHGSFNTHTRGSFSFADTYDGGYINHTYPNTTMDFTSAIAGCTVPVISHETGQFQVYPNYAEIEKYTGVLRPLNMKTFRSRLEKAGMIDQAGDFFKASGAWATELYRADIEMDLRTPGFGGFQLLDLQDYPGQGSAYVGILDAFMDSKELITPEKWREFCCEVVPLFITEKFCWTNNESLTGTVKIANYSEVSLQGKTLNWELKEQEGTVLDKGSIPISSPETGLSDLGKIDSRLSVVSKARKLTLDLAVAGTSYKNSYPFWVYPEATEIQPFHGITVTSSLSPEVADKLKKGGKVLWFPERDRYKKQTVGGLFQTDYWNYRMFRNISESNNKPVSPGTLGILTDPEHALFNDFPTEFHTNWQWFPIIKQSYPFILDRLQSGYKPIVQVIDNVERNHKLGLIFEFNVEGGKLLVCMSDLESVMDKPEARQLYRSMMNYMNSDHFDPETRLSMSSLNDLFSTEVEAGQIEILRNISYE